MLRKFLVSALSLDNDVMATSKSCVKLFSPIFILTCKCLTKFNLTQILKINTDNS